MRNLWRAGTVTTILSGLFLMAYSGVLAQTGSVTIEVRCQPNPEMIRITNRTGGQLTIQRIESSFGPKAPGEPIDVPARLPAHSSIGNDVTVSFENGPGAAGNVLLTVEIFDKGNLANERVIVATDRGTFEVPCGSGSNSQTISVSTSASPGPGIPIRPPTAGEVGGAVGTITAPAQSTVAAAAATAGSASAPFGSVAGTVTAPLQATVGSAAQTGGQNLATVVPPGALATPQLPNIVAGAQQQQPTPTSQSPVPRPGGGTVNGQVFNDLNENGILEAGEPGIGGVSVFLRSVGPDGSAGTPDDAVIGATSTGGDGRFSFGNVQSGSLVVVETDPPNATSTTNNTVPVSVANNTITVNFGDKLPVTAGAAPAQAGGIPPIALLPVGLLLVGLGLFLGRRSGTSAAP